MGSTHSTDASATLERVRAALPIELLVSFHPVAHVDEYVKFLALKLLHNDIDALPPALSPSHLVDAVWHTHMLHPHEYARSCKALLSGRRTVAGSKRRSEDDNVLFKHSTVPRADPRRYTETLRLYKAVFGTKPDPLVWPDEASLSPPTLAYAAPAATSPSKPPAFAFAAVAQPARAAAVPLAMPASSQRLVSVAITSLTGLTFMIRTGLDETVEALKRKIEVETSELPCRQRLTFAGQQLEDHRTLREYNVLDGATIYFVRQLRGC